MYPAYYALSPQVRFQAASAADVPAYLWYGFGFSVAILILIILVFMREGSPLVEGGGGCLLVVVFAVATLIFGIEIIARLLG